MLFIDGSLGIFCKARSGSGNTTTVISNVTGTGTNIVSDGTSFYWGDLVDPTGAIQKVAVGGGSVSNVATTGALPGDVILNGTTIFFIYDAVANDEARDTLRIGSVSTSGGSVTALASASAPVRALASDGTNLYWTEGTNNQNDFAVKYVLVGGGSTTTLISSLPTTAGGIKVSGSFVYFAGQISQQQSGIIKMPVLGGSPTVHISYQGSIGALDIVDNTIYYIEMIGTPPNHTGTLKKAPK